MVSTHGEEEMIKLVRYSLVKSLGAELEEEFGTEVGSTYMLSGENDDGKPEKYWMGETLAASSFDGWSGGIC